MNTAEKLPFSICSTRFFVSISDTTFGELVAKGRYNEVPHDVNALLSAVSSKKTGSWKCGVIIAELSDEIDRKELRRVLEANNFRFACKEEVIALDTTKETAVHKRNTVSEIVCFDRPIHRCCSMCGNKMYLAVARKYERKCLGVKLFGKESLLPRGLRFAIVSADDEKPVFEIPEITFSNGC